MQKNQFDDVTLERFIVGTLEVNCYLLTTEDSAILIDPGFPEDELVERVESLNYLESRMILLTHGHFDHTTACPLLKKNGWKVALHPEDRFLLNRVSPDFAGLGYVDEPFEPSMSLWDGVCFNIGSITLEVVATPGHSPGSVCFIERKRRWAFTGDTLFADSIGRSDLPGGDEQTLMQSLEKLKGVLEPETLVLSGHGGRAKFSTILRINPFLQD
ncbi:MBL fold metallo-hydrolase [candidate division TA06 bacterium B3_TA06]|uniref:MBL fold metallo-hydrolase n=1 Tax=candidate division TA06 bacterium B3_TA06 TaxID=2012487 RepID=A0A532VAQ2_UNCT6|nr:MAG: MBL fold metallo-hydrolase [candidate division TA06 bacterium B3_TA06]